MSALGQKLDICAAKRDILFAPISDRQSRLPRQAMSALTLKAEHVAVQKRCPLGPIADIASPYSNKHPPRGHFSPEVVFRPTCPAAESLVLKRVFPASTQGGMF
jgi:hypothetical protein